MKELARLPRKNPKGQGAEKCFVLGEKKRKKEKKEGGLKNGQAKEEEELFFLSKRSQKGSGGKRGEKWCDWREPNWGTSQMRSSLGPMVGRKAVGTELEEPCVAQLEGWKGCGEERRVAAGSGVILARREGPTVTS